MTGEEHYRVAELLIEAVSAPNELAPNPVIRKNHPEFIAAAQVHATLAVAAALGQAVGGVISRPGPRRDPEEEEV
jgi:hypothetical protein